MQWQERGLREYPVYGYELTKIPKMPKALQKYEEGEKKVFVPISESDSDHRKNIGNFQKLQNPGSQMGSKPLGNSVSQTDTIYLFPHEMETREMKSQHLLRKKA